MKTTRMKMMKNKWRMRRRMGGKRKGSMMKETITTTMMNNKKGMDSSSWSLDSSSRWRKEVNRK
jgi:hypothetical protein